MDAASGTVGLAGVGVAGRQGGYDLTVAGGKVVAMTRSTASGGGFVTPLLADIHVHLDKTHTIGRISEAGPARVDCLFDAIGLMERDRPNWTPDDIRARATRALDAAWRAGVGVMRTHVDWTTPDVPAAWPVMVELRQEWKGRIRLEIAALVSGGIVPDAAAGVARHVRRDGGVLGAFFYRDPGLAQRVEMMFALAVAHDLALDFHVDEGLDADAAGFPLIVEATRRHKMAGRVLCGHACSLSLRSGDELQRILDAAAEAGTGLVALPTSNLYLQDRAGGRSPRLRGLAPLNEARAAGMTVMLASDNVGDAFYPYGDYDPLAALRLAAPVAHVDPAEWIDAVTTTPSGWSGADGGDFLAPGTRADFIWHAAHDARDLASRPRAHRTVYRDGAALPGPSQQWREP